MSEKKPVSKDATPDRALFFELDMLAVPGWSFLYETLKKVLGGHDIKLTLPLFAKYFAGKSVGVALRRLAAGYEKPELTGNEVLEAVKTGYGAAVTSADKAKPGVDMLLRDVRSHGIKLGAVTCLDNDAVEHVLSLLGLSADDVHIMKSEYCGRAAPTARDWLMLAKEMQVSVALCTAAATSAASCKAALCSGLRCFAVPGRMTAYQDFSGVDFVFDSLEGDAEELVLKLVEAY